jgi:hypothetical protein
LKCLVFLVASITCACPAWAAPDSGTPPGLFDPPQAVTRIEGPNLTAAQSFECTWYSDFMLRETETDSPGRGQSYFVQQPANGVPRACPGAHNSSDIPLDRGDTAFMGRKGKFLFYEATDAPSAEPFSIWHVPDGRRIYSDSMNATSGLKAISLVGEVLHLTYVRAYAANCSLLKDSASCWARSMKAGHFARAVAAQPPLFGPESRDATFTRDGEEALWQAVFMAAPERLREFEPSSKRRKRRAAPWPGATG